MTVPDLQCLTMSDQFSASSAKARVGELSSFTATTDPDDAITWVSLGDDQWFLTTESFTHDGAVTFDNAEGKIGTSSEGYPTTFDESGTLNGTLTCTSQKTL